MTYTWYVLYPWTNQWELRTGETNWYMVWTNADLWENGTFVGLSVSNAAGETLWLAESLHVLPLPIRIPATNFSSGSGPASRYPATINVRGQPAGFSHVEVSLKDLTHYYPADLDILLVSPSGAEVMLISDAGGYTPVTHATLGFHPASQWPGFWPVPPEANPIPSNQTTDYRAYNYGVQETQLETQPPYLAPPEEYTDTLDRLPFSDADPNGVWKLYIYDDKTSHVGELHDSWSLRFIYE